MDHKVIVKNNHIEVNNYSLGDGKKIERYFSIWDPVNFKLFHKGMYYDEKNKKLYLARGMDIPLIKDQISKDVYVDRKCNPYDKMGDVKLFYKPRCEVQKEALTFMLGKLKYHNNEAKSQFQINLDTGKGKTYCSIATAVTLNIRTSLITSTITWINQWKKCIVDYTDIKEEEVYIATGKSKLNKLLKEGADKYKFILFSHSSIRSYANEYGWNKVGELFERIRVGINIYDEAHLSFDNMAMVDFHTNIYKTYYVTATPARSDNDENRIYGYYFKNVVSISLFNDDEDPRTHYISLLYNSRPKPMHISKCRTKHGFSTIKYASYVQGNSTFYDMLVIVLELALRNGQKNIFYVATNETILHLVKWIGDNYPEISDHIGIYTSISKDKKGALEKRIIFSTTKSMGTGVDIKGLKMVVLLAEPFKSKVLAKQSLGRTRDNDTHYIELVDVGFPAIKRWYKEKKSVFKKYALSTTEIPLTYSDVLSRKNKASNTIREQHKIVKTFAGVDPYEITTYKTVPYLVINESVVPYKFID